MIAIVFDKQRLDFLELCKAFELSVIEVDRIQDRTVFDVYGSAESLYLIGVGIGIEIGEQRMWDAVMKRNDN
jgi:hypothetical protein